MIYTLTFCPSLEYSASLSEISTGSDNTLSDGALKVSGGGAVIAQIINELGVKSTVLGFAAGFSGGELETILRGQGINTDFIYLEKGLSPLNVVLDHGEKRTSFTAPSPEISHKELMSLFSRLEQLTDGDMLVLSGAVPPSVPADIYSHLPDAFAGKDVRVILDIPSELLAQCLSLNPFLVVTDSNKVAEIFGEPPRTEEEGIKYITHLQEMGAQNLLIYNEVDSTAILLDSNKNILNRKMVIGTQFNETVLYSLAAGFIVGCADKDVDNEYSLMLAASSAQAAAIQKGVPSKMQILNIMKMIMKGSQ